MQTGPHPLSPEDPRFAQLRQLTEVSRALTHALSFDAVVRLTADRAAELLGAQTAVLMLSTDAGEFTVAAVHQIPDDVRQQFHAALDETLADQLQGLLGTDPEHLLAVPLVAGGKVIGILAVGRRRSEGDDSEELLLSALADLAAVALEKTRLDEAAGFRERLLGIVGHDLKNPLQAIHLAASALQGHSELDEKGKRLVQRVLNSSSRMANMISQLLDFTRSRLGGGITLEQKPIDLNELCRAIAEELELAYPGAAITLHCAGVLEGVWDRERLGRVIANLLANAIQHGAPKSEVKLSTRGDPARAYLSVHNDGPPIPPQLLPEVFSPFRRSNSEGRSPNGLGLGLYIAEQIIHAHGGQIAIESSEASGTVVSFEIPRQALH
jgi:sigma-B regulation protein RsbU (phosphoserine phosphatase)